MNIVKSLVILAIRFYQKYISPLKGFSCAHGVRHGGDSCSGAILKMVQRRGVVAAYKGQQVQFKRCRSAYQQLQDESEQGKRKKPPKRKQKNSEECMKHSCDTLDCVSDGGKNCDGHCLPCD